VYKENTKIRVNNRIKNLNPLRVNVEYTNRVEKLGFTQMKNRIFWRGLGI